MCTPADHTYTYFYAFVRTFTNTRMSPGPILNPSVMAKVPNPNLQFYPETPKQTFVVVGTKCSYFIKISLLQMNREFWSSLCRVHKNTNAHAVSAVV